MKIEKKDLSKVLLILGVIVAVVGVSYALWRVSFSSTNDNSLTATCFNVSFTDQNNISIEKAYPLTDEDGKKLTPYTFTITNNCDTYASYDINLEVLNTSTLTNMNYIKMSLDDDILSLVSSLDVTTKTLSNASSAYKIKTSYLNAKESKTYNLRLWLDENVTGETKDVQNNTFTSKITVNASYITEAPKPTLVDYVTTLAGTDTTNLVADDYGNVRYIGKNPNNYIKVDGEEYTSDVYYGYIADTNLYRTYSSLTECESAERFNSNCALKYSKSEPILWRIIGVMNNIDNGNNKKEKRVKIIRNESIGSYSWDTSDSSVNNGGGVNEWSQADLMKLLNPGYESETVGGSLYWSNKSGTCYNHKNNGTIPCDFTNTGIKDSLKNMIGNALWNTGASTKTNQIVSDFYLVERGANTGKMCTIGAYCNDTITRTTTWTGKVGLMYPSDYGYATSGESTTDRATCLNQFMSNWQSCLSNDWLYKADADYINFITPLAEPSHATLIVATDDFGDLSRSSVINFHSAYPSAYLLSSVKVLSGTGTSSDPFILEN